jgi:hypothetical protein
MTVRSILFPDPEAPLVTEEPPSSVLFDDLKLDQVISSATTRRDAYELQPFYFAPLSDLDSIVYRQEVFADLEDDAVHEVLSRFAAEEVVARFSYRVKDLREDDGGYNHYHRARYFLNATMHYRDVVERLSSGLAECQLGSVALRDVRSYLAGYVTSGAFTDLGTEALAVRRALDEVRYCVLVKGDRVTVGPYGGEEDYSEQVGATFARFQHGAVKDYLPELKDQASFAGAGILDLVAKVFPEVFEKLDAFCAKHLGYLDDTVRTLDRELQFYLSYVDYIQPMRAAGLGFSTPVVSSSSKEEQALETFDLALAAQLTARGELVVCNDLVLSDPERILVVTGPNNGGKTTFARTFGQLHYLARLGFPVPGRETHLFLCDHIFTHFEKEEDATSLAGKLQDELDRMKADFDRSTSSSIFVLNEVFNSTSADDALFLSREILDRLDALDALGVCVTFLDELASLSEKVVSMVSTVVPDDPAIRTHKVVRKPADGRAYAQAIADKYGLSYERLAAEIGR